MGIQIMALNIRTICGKLICYVRGKMWYETIPGKISGATKENYEKPRS
jgi:hypothetical protein